MKGMMPAIAVLAITATIIALTVLEYVWSSTLVSTAGQNPQVMVESTLARIKNDTQKLSSYDRYPSVDVVQSPENPQKGDIVTLTATATDDKGLTKIQIFVDDSLAESCPVSGETASCIKSDAFSAGIHSYYAKATDTKSQTSTNQTEYLNITCTENWNCTNWSSCIDGTHTRICTDLNSCGTDANKSTESQSCDVTCTESWSCTDWSSCISGMQSRICTDSNNCGTVVNKSTEAQACSGTLSFSRISSLPVSGSIFTKFPQPDFNGNGRSEFFSGSNAYESLSDNNFLNVAILTISESYYGDMGGDSDNDGKRELLAYGRSGNYFYIRVYESVTTNGFPSVKSWETSAGSGAIDAKMSDVNNDGKSDIIFGGYETNNSQTLNVFKSVGDNSYVNIYSAIAPNLIASQCLGVMDDLDNDGKKEIVFGGMGDSSGYLYMYENTGGDSFSQVWSYSMLHSDGQKINCKSVVYAGDMDGDGKKEFVAGGSKTVPQLGYPFYAVYYVFESTGDNVFQKVAEVKKLEDMYVETSINVGDLNNDGRNEIVMTTERCPSRDGIYVFQSSGNNQFSELWDHIWSRPCNYSQSLDSIGIGDYDADGKKEIIFNENSNTVVYEASQNPLTCKENWKCNNWSSCYYGMQSRSCNDLNACGTALNLSEEFQTCTQNATCSITHDDICPSFCSYNSDIDCCTQAGRYWLYKDSRYGEYGCYATNYSAGCGPGQYCSNNIFDNCCPQWCGESVDADCCVQHGYYWLQMSQSSYTCSVTNYTQGCGPAIDCKVTATDGCCPQWCGINVDADCCAKTGKTLKQFSYGWSCV